MISDPTDRTTVLRDSHVTLRAWSPRYAADLEAACQDEEIRKWTPVSVPFTARDAANFIAASEDYWSNGLPNFAVMAGDDALVGAIGFVARPVDDVLEVAYWLTPTGRGRGLAISALRLISVWALTELNVERVEWTAYVGNVRSLAVATAAGFRLEGTLRGRATHRGDRRDVWMASLLKEDLTLSGFDPGNQDMTENP